MSFVFHQLTSGVTLHRNMILQSMRRGAATLTLAPSTLFIHPLNLKCAAVNCKHFSKHTNSTSGHAAVLPGMALRILSATSAQGRLHCLETARWCSSSSANMQKENCVKHKLVAVQESRRFMIDCFTAANTSSKNARAMADLLVAADYRGHFSHGMNRLEMYINDLLLNSTDGHIAPKVIKENAATAWVDGQNGLGAVVGNFCMELAIQKALKVGVGWVCAKRSNHYGMAGWYSMQAMREGLIGISMTNTSPLMAPTRSKEAALGTNPLAIGAPARGENFLLDMATTAVAVGKIEIERRKGAPIPYGWAQDPDGNQTTDAELAFRTGCLCPLGGSEITSGYKGYGLGAAVDVLCGILSGSNYSTKVRKWAHTGANTEADLGQVFIAVDPKCFAPGFEDRMEDFHDRLHALQPTDPNKPVLIPGEKEHENMVAVDAAGGIQYLENQLKTCESLAERLKIQPLRFV